VDDHDRRCEQLTHLFADTQDVIFLGRGINFPIALEGALKLKEISYIHAEGYPAGEMKHGPIALLDARVPVVSIAVPGTVFDKVLSNAQEAKARVACKRVLFNNGSAYRSKPWREACTALGLRPKRTRPSYPGPTAKRSVSSRPCWLNGTTQCSSRPQVNGTGGYRAIRRSITAAGATWPWRAALPISCSDSYGLLNDLARKYTYSGGELLAKSVLWDGKAARSANDPVFDRLLDLDNRLQPPHAIRAEAPEKLVQWLKDDAPKEPLHAYFLRPEQEAQRVPPLVG
jgi:hypothetical protein